MDLARKLPYLRVMLAKARAALSHRRLPLAVAGIAAILSLPSLGNGLVLDDYVLRAGALGRAAEVGLSVTRFDLFSFFSDAPGARSLGIDSGWAPWWSAVDLRVRFFRPLSSFTHWLDFQVWPTSPAAMHLVNVAIYVCLVAVVAIFYRRFMGLTWIAGLAAVFYALDPGHSQAVSLVAGRNTILAPLFGVLALIAYDRYRRDAWKPGRAVSAALFAGSLLAGESGVSTGLYLVAYAMCLDSTPERLRRLRPLAPHALIAVAWVLAYKALQYGSRGSAMYTDPGHDTLTYLRQVLVHGPIFLHGELGLPFASVFSLLSVRGTLVLAASGVLFCALFARLAWPVLRDDPVARFFTLGMVLSLLPICAIIPNDRVLFFVGLGGVGLVAQFVVAALSGAERAPLVHRGFAWFLAIVHGPIAALLFLANTQLIPVLGEASRKPLDEILLESQVAKQTAVIVNAPAQFMVSHLAPMRLDTTKPIPLRWRYLAPGIYPLEVTRLDARTLTVRSPGGLLQTPGTWNVDGQERSPLFNASYGSQWLSQIMRRSDDPMHAGETVALTGVTIEVREVSPDGRPVDVQFTFDEPLESPALRWFAWEHGHLVPFAPPPVGQRMTLAPVSATPG